ncbi:MAG TPA: hypothetical protein VGR35_23075 [Tepidisphaeraceae bacterium]|nr:hypothetical protein [Tepidisphaeraceae bacterium]
MRHYLPWICALLLLPLGCGKRESAAPTNTAARHASTAPADAAAGHSTVGPTTTLSAAEESALEQKLNGVWVAEDVDAALGTVKIQLTFQKVGPMKLAAWSDIPFVGQVRDKTAPYEVDGNVISSEAIRGGTTVEYWFDGDDLIIKYREGKTVRFQRQ